MITLQPQQARIIDAIFDNHGLLIWLAIFQCPRPWHLKTADIGADVITLGSTPQLFHDGLVTSPALPSRREVYRKIPSLPKFPTLSETDQEYIVAALKHL